MGFMTRAFIQTNTRCLSFYYFISRGYFRIAIDYFSSGNSLAYLYDHKISEDSGRKCPGLKHWCDFFLITVDPIF